MNNINTSDANSTTTITHSKKTKVPYMIIPDMDWSWVDSQPGFVVTLWRECWKCDKYGSRWVELPTSSLSKNRFASARKTIESAGLFRFKSEKLFSDGRKIDKWFVLNLHGSRVDSFWHNPVGEKINPIGEKINPIGLPISPEILTEQASYNASISSQYLSNKLNQEKEINNTNTLYENKYIKPDLDQARAKEKNQGVKEREATLNATPQTLVKQDEECVSVETIPIKELSAIAKANYADQLPTLKEGYFSKSISLRDGCKTTLYVLHLDRVGVDDARNLVNKDDENKTLTRQFLKAYADCVVATFSFVGKEIHEFARCG